MVELFTSQGCSSCPPADKIIGELAKDPSVIALSMPIDYWDYLGWKDTLADSRFSARQKAYSHMRGDRNVYTPQVVVNGSAQVIGSDRAGIDGAISETQKADGVMSVGWKSPRPVRSMTRIMAYNYLSRWSGTLGVCAIVAIIRPAHADPRAVVELFTSQGCSSCPAADKIVGELASDPSVIALSLPIDYWDYLGWKDTLANSRFTARQRAYSAKRGDREVYTPQVVVNGQAQVVGNDRARSITPSATPRPRPA